jgi:LysM repeat protein
MRKVIPVLLLSGVVSIVGCKNNKNTPAKAPPPPPATDTYSGTATPVPPSPPIVVEPVPATPVAPAPPPPSSSHTYTVKKGDTMSKIAREQLGGISQLGALIRANPGIDKDHIKPGQVLNLP